MGVYIDMFVACRDKLMIPHEAVGVAALIAVVPYLSATSAIAPDAGTQLV